MFIQNDQAIVLPLSDEIAHITTEEIATANEKSNWAIDGTGKLQVTATGGASAAEGGMGSSSDSEKEKGALQQPLTGENGGTANSDTDTGWDPMKKNIDKETANKQNEDE